MKLKMYLAKYHLTVTEFAKKLGLSRNYINRIVNANIIPSKHLAKLIEIETNGEVSVTDLLFPEKFTLKVKGEKYESMPF